MERHSELSLQTLLKYTDVQQAIAKVTKNNHAKCIANMEKIMKGTTQGKSTNIYLKERREGSFTNTTKIPNLGNECSLHSIFIFNCVGNRKRLFFVRCCVLRIYARLLFVAKLKKRYLAKTELISSAETNSFLSVYVGI